MSMSRSVAGLPLELLINVVSHLNLEDFIHLKLASGELFQLLNNESLSREMVKVALFLSLFLCPTRPDIMLFIRNPNLI